MKCKFASRLQVLSDWHWVRNLSPLMDEHGLNPLALSPHIKDKRTRLPVISFDLFGSMKPDMKAQVAKLRTETPGSSRTVCCPLQKAKLNFQEETDDSNGFQSENGEDDHSCLLFSVFFLYFHIRKSKIILSQIKQPDEKSVFSCAVHHYFIWLYLKKTWAIKLKRQEGIQVVDLRWTLPGQVASAASFKQGHTPPELPKVLSDETHAGVSLQRHGSHVQHTVTLPFQQLVQLLFQENLTQTHKSKLNGIYFLCKIHLTLFCTCTCYWESSPCWLPADTSCSWPGRACGAWWHSFLRLQVEDPSGRAGLYTCVHVQCTATHKFKMTIWYEFWRKSQED